MDNYVTGTTVKKLRENKRMTQAELSEKIGVSDKTISKWETMRGHGMIYAYCNRHGLVKFKV